MCGFTGFFHFNKPTFSHSERMRILQAMGAQISRRGPDDEQFYDDESLSFVFRRLSIIDVEGGQQPIWNEDESIFVAVNGEIYNHDDLRSSLKGAHTFRTRSDSEIVLHLYEDFGEAVLQMLNGMFAIVIWDTRNKKLLLARDRLGIKPLYYYQNDNIFLFGSELKAMLVHPECPRNINWEDLRIIGPQQTPEVPTYINDVHYLAGGHYLSCTRNKCSEQTSYWSILDCLQNPNYSLSSEQYISEYKNLFEDSVNKRLMSDVPVGLFLSGGIDSSLIAAVAAKTKADIHCFTFVSEPTYKAGDVQQAESVAKDLGVPFHPVLFNFDTLLSEIDFGLSHFEYFIWVMDSPRFDLEWFFKHELYRYARTVVPDLKVILLGQGADEFAGGYSTRLDTTRPSWNDYLHQEIYPEFKELNEEKLHIPERMRNLMPQGESDAYTDEGLSDYQRKMHLLINQLQHFNLWHEDRISSSQGIEARVPFLDHRLVELLASIPQQYHEELFWNKEIVRQTLKAKLPTYPQYKEKVSFFVTDDLDVVNDFARQIIAIVFPAFRKKYFLNRTSIFSEEKLEKLYNKAISRGTDQLYEIGLLLECISIEIFSALCSSAAKGKTDFTCLNHSSPLTVVGEPFQNNLETLFPKPHSDSNQEQKNPAHREKENDGEAETINPDKKNRLVNKILGGLIR